MQTHKFHISGKSVQLYKEAWQPYVYGKIDKVPFRFSIDNGLIKLVEGTIEEDILPRVVGIIAQYYLPVEGAKITKRKLE